MIGLGTQDSQSIFEMNGTRDKARRSIEEVLASTSAVLFPEKMGTAAVEVNSRDVMGDSPLHVMARRTDRHAVRLLLDSGANVDVVGDMGETALHIAIRQGDLENVRTLLWFGASTSIQSEFGETAIDAAARMGGEMGRLVGLRRR